MVSAFKKDNYMMETYHQLVNKYQCAICLRILQSPVQLGCGHRRCAKCVPPEDEPIHCSECEEITFHKQIMQDKACGREMEKYPIKCNACPWTGFLINYQTHLDDSHQDFKCPFCAEKFSGKTRLEEHETKFCEKVLISCILEQDGCKKKIPRGEMPRHYRTREHQSALVQLLLKLNALRQNQKQVRLEDESSLAKGDNNIQQMDTTTTSSTGQNKDSYADKLNHLREIIKILGGGSQALETQIQKLDEELEQHSRSVDETRQCVTKVKESIEETNNSLDAILTNLTILQQEIHSLKHRYEEQMATSYDGTLVWKIKGVAAKMEDAKTERQMSIYSPPFYSSPNGYKMCARLYLFGDGNARRTHMSIFFVLMRTKHDSLLEFPFKYKVTFCLFDQTGRQNHIIDSFRPDIKSNSFQKPRSEMNIASGIPKFAALQNFELDNPYIKNDAMFIRISVDFSNIPRKVLPFALKLNPGLPMHTQQLLINKEIEKLPKESATTQNG